MNVIDSNKLEGDAGGKPVPTFSSSRSERQPSHAHGVASHATCNLALHKGFAAGS